jgi:hypothetical protein
MDIATIITRKPKSKKILIKSKSIYLIEYSDKMIKWKHFIYTLSKL